MIVHDVEQGSDEWLDLRIGKITGSNFGELITPLGKRRAGKGVDSFLWSVVDERLTNRSESSFAGNYWTERGNELEPVAIANYELDKGVEVQPAGFVEVSPYCGVSPDGLVDDAGGVECKCLAGKNHLMYACAGVVPDDYKAQVQGNLWACEREWWDYIGYHPDHRLFVVREYRDEKFITELEIAINEASEIIEERCAKLMEV